MQQLQTESTAGVTEVGNLPTLLQDLTSVQLFVNETESKHVMSAPELQLVQQQKMTSTFSVRKYPYLVSTVTTNTLKTSN